MFKFREFPGPHLNYQQAFIKSVPASSCARSMSVPVLAVMICRLMKHRFPERPLIQYADRFIERIASVPALALFIFLSLLFPAVVFPVHGISDITPLDLHFSYSPDQVYEHLAALGANGRDAYTRMLLTSDLVFPVIYSMALSIALMLVLRKLLPLASTYLCLFPFMIVISDWFENLNLVFVVRKFPERADVIAGYASSFTSLKWGLVVLTALILLISVAFRVARNIRNR